MRRLWNLLYWQAQFDSRRPMMWLVGAGYLLAAGPCTLGILGLVGWRTGIPVSGRAYLTALTILHSISGVLYAAHLAARAADERANGFLAMLQITDLPATVLTTYRTLGAIIGLLPLWLMRLPLYVWCYHLGGAQLDFFLAAEAIIWLATLFALAISILCSQLSRSYQTALTLIGGVLVGSQGIPLLPRLFMRISRLALGPLPAAFDTVNEWANDLSRCTLIEPIRRPPEDLADWGSILPAIGLHLTAAAAALIASWRLTYANVLPDDTPHKTAQRPGPPRRVEGDALAWQAIHIHLNRGRMRTAAVAFDVVLLIIVLASTLTLPPIGVGMLALAVSFRALMTASMRAGVCVAAEIRDQTLSTLALLPREPLEFFRSWRKGGIQVSKLEYLTAAIGAVLVAWNMGQPAAGLLGVMVAMTLFAPFGFLNMLCRFEWAVFSLSLWIFPLGFGFLALSVTVGAYTNIWGGLAMFCVLALVYHAIILRQIPYYFLKAVARG